MSIEQTRPYESPLYDGSEDASTVFVVVDKPTWDKPKRYGLDSFVGGSVSLHIERDILTSLSSRDIIVEFETPFDSIPNGDEPMVYRMFEEQPGVWRRRNVLWGFTSSSGVTPTGFSIKIDDSENLTGVVVQYLYQ